MGRPFYRAEPVHEDIYFVVGQAAHDGPLYEVDQCRGWDAACAIIERLNATAEGLRRIGVAVAVWGAMAAVQQRMRMSARMNAWEAVAMSYRRLHEEAEADLAAERAARRKWELRLRARRTAPEYEAADRLKWRALCAAEGDGGIHRVDRRFPLAGPRGVLP